MQQKKFRVLPKCNPVPVQRAKSDTTLENDGEGRREADDGSRGRKPTGEGGRERDRSKLGAAARVRGRRWVTRVSA